MTGDTRCLVFIFMIVFGSVGLCLRLIYLSLTCVTVCLVVVSRQWTDYVSDDNV